MGAETILALLIKAKDQTKGLITTVTREIGNLDTRVASAASGGMKQFKTSFSSLGSVITSLVTNQFALLLGVGGIGGLITSSLMAQDQFEKGLLKYKTLLGSEEEAIKRINELREFSAKTPFELEGIVKADTILQGFGIRTADLLYTIGDAAAISGSDMSDLSLVIGQLSQSKDLENIKQLVERGVVSFTELKAAGIQFAKDGSVINSVEETYGAVVSIMQNKFGGGMDSLSNTLSGRISTLKDNFTLALAQISQDTGMQDFAKNAVGSLSVLVEKYTPAVVKAIIDIKDAASDLVKFMQDNKDLTIAIFAAIAIVVIGSVVPAFVAWAAATIVATAPILVMIIVIAAIIYAILYLKDNIDEVKKGITDAFNKIADAFQPLLDKFNELKEKSKLFKLLADIILQPFTSIFAMFKFFFEQIVLTVTTVFNIIKGIVTGDTDLIKEAIQGFIDGTFGNFKELLDSFTTIGQDLLDIFLGVFEGIYNKAGEAFELVKTLVGAGVEWLLAHLFGFKDGVTTIFTSIAETIGSKIAGAVSFVKTQVDAVVGFFVNGFEWIKDTITGALDYARDKLTSFGNSVVDIFKSLFDSVSGAPGQLANAFKDIINGLVDKINDLFSFEIDVGLKTVNVDLPDLPRFDVGSNRVPHDMIAQIHKDEMITPADRNPFNPNASRPLALGDNGSNVDNSRIVNVENVTINNNTDLEVFFNTINTQLNWSI